MRRCDVLVVGAGPSGTVAAALLVARGYAVTILEREHFPRFSIGESLLPQCMEFIESANMLDAVRACGFQRKDGAVFARGEQSSSFEFADQFSANAWTSTFEVPRATFDHALALRAIELGVEVRFGEEIVGVEACTEACAIKTRDRAGRERGHESRFVLDASGFGRVLPRLLGLDAPSGFPVRQSLFTHVEDRVTAPGYDRDKILITVHAGQTDVWYWLIPFSNGRSSIGVVATEPYLAGRRGDARARLEELVREDAGLGTLLAGAVFDTPVRQITGYASNVTRMWGNGYALLGNAGEFLDPVFSSGVTIAMKSATLAAAALDRQLRGEPVDWEAEFAAPLARGVDVFRVFVESWYDGRLQSVIFSELKDARIKRMICSILAGYVWDLANPYVARPRQRLDALAAYCAAS